MTVSGDTSSDADLAGHVMAGDERGRESEAELCRRFAPRLRAYGRRHLHDRDAAEDLVQRVLVLMIDKLRAREVREVENVVSFVLGSAHHIARTMRRSEARLRPLSESTEPWCEPSLPIDTQRLAECMQRLGDRERTVVALTFGDEMKAQEVANITGTTSGNVRIIRHRALAALRECIEGRPS